MMNKSELASIHLPGVELLLHPFRAAYWPERSALLVADLHLGKAQHFRREGIPVPKQAGNETWDRLLSLLVDFQPKELLILGDLFHSAYNVVWEEFIKLVAQFDQVQFTLVGGNHDILSDYQYERSGLVVVEEPFQVDQLLLSHHPMDSVPEGYYNLAGHIHPGVALSGGGRQRLRLPCFFFGLQQGLLPAFGAFTGMATVQPTTEDRVFVVTQDAVMEVFGQ